MVTHIAIVLSIVAEQLRESLSESESLEYLPYPLLLLAGWFVCAIGALLAIKAAAIAISSLSAMMAVFPPFVWFASAFEHPFLAKLLLLAFLLPAAGTIFAWKHLRGSFAERKKIHPERWYKSGQAIPDIFIWPILLMLPVTLGFLSLDQILANASGGRDSMEYADAISRIGLAILPVYFTQIIGAFLWIPAVGVLVLSLRQPQRIHWLWAFLLLLGVLSHVWVMSPIWELTENLIERLR